MFKYILIFILTHNLFRTTILSLMRNQMNQAKYIVKSTKFPEKNNSIIRIPFFVAIITTCFIVYQNYGLRPTAYNY